MIIKIVFISLNVGSIDKPMLKLQLSVLFFMVVCSFVVVALVFFVSFVLLFFAVSSNALLLLYCGWTRFLGLFLLGLILLV